MHAWEGGILHAWMWLDGHPWGTWRTHSSSPFASCGLMLALKVYERKPNTFLEWDYLSIYDAPIFCIIYWVLY